MEQNIRTTRRRGVLKDWHKQALRSLIFDGLTFGQAAASVGHSRTQLFRVRMSPEGQAFSAELHNLAARTMLAVRMMQLLSPATARSMHPRARARAQRAQARRERSGLG